ncbi:MAG: DUF1343 domain-containing protein [Polyangiales bacterium]
MERAAAVGLFLAITLGVLETGCGESRSTNPTAPRPRSQASTPPGAPSASPSAGPGSVDPTTVPFMPAPPPLRMPVEAALAVEDAVHAAMDRKELPGAVVVVGDKRGVALRRAFGRRAWIPEVEAMSEDTIFDLASLTKVLVTEPLVFRLVAEGKLRLDTKVASVLPAFGAAGKGEVTVRELLLHTSGLPSVNALSDYVGTREESLAKIYALPLAHRPGSTFDYSDLGYIVLGAVVETVSGERLDALASRVLFAPLGMDDTGFDVGHRSTARTAPTEITDKRTGSEMLIRGDVHDPRAFRLGGVSGHAGLFSTADDLSTFARMMLGDGQVDGVRVLPSASVAAMTEATSLPGAVVRAGSWDMRSHYTKQRADGFSERAYGHSGFTGVSLWIDPELDLFVLVLSNRVHPDGKGDARPLAKAIADIAVASRPRFRPTSPSTVLSGVDALRRMDFTILRGRHVGLITNASGRARDGTTTRELLARAPEVHLEVLFSPEHGLGGGEEGHVTSSTDALTGLPVRSLFGANRAPADADLEGIDTLVFDLQDVGVRFYTYGSTMFRAMEKASERKMRFVVLDRPNPLGDLGVRCPVSELPERTFVNYEPLPVLHGMTVGELASYLRRKHSLPIDLIVVPVDGYTHATPWEATGLPWFPPSPNLPNLTAVRAYAVTGLVEATNVSVGRGTSSPFSTIGAPWLDALKVSATLNHLGLAGIAFAPAELRATVGPHKNKSVPAVRMEGVPREPVRAGLALAGVLATAYPGEFALDDAAKMIRSDAIVNTLRAGKVPTEAELAQSPGCQDFLRAREDVRLYP